MNSMISDVTVLCILVGFVCSITVLRFGDKWLRKKYMFFQPQTGTIHFESLARIITLNVQECSVSSFHKIEMSFGMGME